ncbi:MAG TPA: hypothetical protein VGH10_01025, partial [Actinomycetota bacterium]
TGEGSDLAWADEAQARDAVRDRAFPVLIAAGAAARNRNATERGLELHQVALELARGDREHAEAFEELGDDHGWSYHGDPSTTAWNRALELWRALGEDDACARVCLKAARHTAIYWGGFASRPSGATVDAYVDEGLDKARDPLSRAWLLSLRGLARASYSSAGEQDPRSQEVRVDAAEEAASLARTIDDTNALALAQRTLCALYLDMGRSADALALAERQLDLVDRIGSQRTRNLETLMSLAQIMDIGGDFPRALEFAGDVRRRSADSSAHERMHATYYEMAVLYRMGRWQDVPALLDEHLAAFAEETVDMNCPFTRSGPVVGALVMEQLREADAAARASDSIYPNDDEPGMVEGWMAERELLNGRPDAAAEIARRTVAFGRGPTIEQPFYEWPVLVEALAALERWDELEAAVADVRTRSANVAWLEPAIDRAEAARLASHGDSEGAAASLRRALDAYRRMGMSAEIATTLERLALVEGQELEKAAHLEEAEAIRAVVTGSTGVQP